MLITAMIGLVVSLSAMAVNALASIQNNGIGFKPDKVQIVVNEDTGEVACDSFELYNNTDNTYIFEKSELVLSEDAKKVSTEQDWDLSINAVNLHSYLYDGKPGTYNIPLDKIEALSPGMTSSINLNFRKIDTLIAKQLIDKKVFTLTVFPYENIVDVPQASEGLIFNNKEQTGVPEGEGYEITNNKQTNVGSYEAIATIKNGMIWSDKTVSDKKIN